MLRPLRAAPRALTDYVNTKVVRWRTGTTDGQVTVLLVLLAVACAMMGLSLWNYNLVPLMAFAIPAVLGSLLLRFRPLVVLYVLLFACMLISVSIAGMSYLRLYSVALFAVSASLLVYQANRNQSGLPGPLGEAMLVDLRDRLQAQGKVPPLPPGWVSQSAVKTAGGVNFSGDFLVAVLARGDQKLDMILVDVCGKGVSAGTQSLHFAGALGGLLGALPPVKLFEAANQFLLRQEWEDGFATAAHVVLDLKSGDYTVVSAGHPPALRWDSSWTEWFVDGARGVALGVMEDPEFTVSTGNLKHGDALLFYTDGVTESHSHDLDEGIRWLVDAATDGIAKHGFDGLPSKVLSKIVRGDDDQAILMIARES